MDVFDLRRSVLVATDLREICGRKTSAATRCTIARRGAVLRVTVDADDPDMLDLIASVSRPETDKFIYEEDCVQVAVALPGAASARDWLLVNPCGGRRGSGAGREWPATARRHARGWAICVDVPLAAGVTCLGLSVHRFFRGAGHEVHGFGRELPFPLDAARFAAVVVGGDGEAADAAASYRELAERSAQKKIEETLSDVRRRMAAARQKGGPTPSLEAAVALARKRAAMPVQPGEGFLCWNEAYFHHALMDLWELTGERQWLEMAIPRMDEVWSLRADRRGLPDALWGEVLPTWYNDTETGAPCTLTTGVILNPITRMLRILRDARGLSDLCQRVAPWIPMCRESVALHDREWVEFPDGSGMHLEPFQKGPRRVYPHGGSRVNPLNREFAFGMAMLNLARVLADEEYLRKVTMMARFFRNTSEITDDTFVWEYAVGACPAKGEDVNHGHCQVLFAEMCCREGIVISEEDLRRIARTLARNVFRYGDVPCGSIRGYDPGLHEGVGVWSSLCRYVPEVLPRIVAVVETQMREGGRYFEVEGWGLRILTCIEKARRAVEARSGGGAGHVRD